MISKFFNFAIEFPILIEAPARKPNCKIYVAGHLIQTRSFWPIAKEIDDRKSDCEAIIRCKFVTGTVIIVELEIGKLHISLIQELHGLEVSEDSQNTK